MMGTLRQVTIPNFMLKRAGAGDIGVLWDFSTTQFYQK